MSVVKFLDATDGYKIYSENIHFRKNIYMYIFEEIYFRGFTNPLQKYKISVRL